MVTVKIYKATTNVDRYHLLAWDTDFTASDIQYTESGDAFNGFANPVILNTDYHDIIDCRIMSIEGITAYGNDPVYFLIENVTPLNNGKVAVFGSYDSWMNCKSTFRLGDQNDLFETSKFLSDYPYYQKVGKYKQIKIDRPIQDMATQDYKIHLIVLYNNKDNNIDYIYYFGFRSISNIQKLYWGENNILSKLGILPASILGMWLSPIIPDVTGWTNAQSVIADTDVNCYYTQHYNLYENYFGNVITNPIRINRTIHNDDLVQDCVLDTNGGIAWISETKDIGLRTFEGYLNVTYSVCTWDFFVVKSNAGNWAKLNPNDKFAINCPSVGFMADYFQTYLNLYKNYNAELRKAQLDKQIVDSIGNVVSSTFNMGVMSGLGGKATPGAIGGFAGSTIQNVLGIWSQDDYNKKLEKIENAQAKIQLDTQITSGENIIGLMSGWGAPCFATITIDDETRKSYIIKSIPSTPEPIEIRKIVYRCGIQSDDLMNLIKSKPFYLAGDFDFIGMSAYDSAQLKERFRHGVNFVNWGN